MLASFPSKITPNGGESSLTLGPIEPEASIAFLAFHQQNWPKGGGKGADIDMLWSPDGVTWNLLQSFDVTDEQQGGFTANANATGNPAKVGLSAIPLPLDTFIGVANIPDVGNPARMLRVVVRAAIAARLEGFIESILPGQPHSPFPWAV